ncbi:MAG: Na/Pi cotransporter family protein [Prevotella sp.]|nr:Na/Pi cotransporter family protein [Prevotella sp.]MBQ1759234.1 Na/Pi cotransporter family protein [Prevotella sp.]MBQ2215878.1 Na/Pi cotransporter family protein [Prevotella sp.]MBQ2523418.1 Na/Pi cotransporter family protein [Prevotella sp.]MBQ5457003.1 Na/Pi cotransporter family protein [Prevotella sp.]
MSILVIFKLLGSLSLLMFGMKSMSDALQKMVGSQLRHVLGAKTTNRFTGVLSGMFVTAAVQSSTATTVMTVSFVSAGLLTLMQAISVIMGAHIGTTVTAWIMSLAFSFNTSNFVYPAFFLGIILIYMKSKRIIGDFLFGAAFLFLGLGTLKETGFNLVRVPETAEAISAFFANFNEPNFWNSFFFLIMGTVLTLCVQSSAAIMAITMILCSTGILHIDQGIMLVLGENIGTTITANIVASTANTSARRAAFAHLAINVLGVTWALILLRPFINLVCGLVGFDRAIDISHPMYADNLQKASIVLAAFHSMFNITNTLLLIWFVPQIERFVCWAINPKKQEEEEDFRLHFITSGIMKTPELSVLEAQKEIHSFAERIKLMFNMVCELLVEKDENNFKKLYERIEKYEKISDNMEIEIAHYLNNVSDAHLSDETKAKIRAMLREISEIESIGDACFNMARTILRKVSNKKDHFTEAQYAHLHQMMQLTENALEEMNVLMGGRKESYDKNRIFNIENEINNYRNQLKSQNISDVNNHVYTYAVGTIYMDLVNECERLGDYVVNVVEARMGIRLKEA